MLMWTWRLLRDKEWGALSSIGKSPWYMLRAPLLWMMVFGLVDIFYIVPFSQRFFNPLEGKTAQFSLDSAGWRRGKIPQGYVFIRDTVGGTHLLFFTKDCAFQRHIVAEKISLTPTEMICTNSMDIQVHRTPQHVPMLSLPLDQPLQLENQSDHPITMSLGQVNAQIQNTTQASLLLYGRRHYWWSHFFWSLALIPLAPAILLGPSHRYKKMLWTGGAILGCLGLYSFKEILYAMSVTLSHTWHPILLWGPAVCTSVMALVLFFEKKEW
jgi:hypothetical protein